MSLLGAVEGMMNEIYSQLNEQHNAGNSKLCNRTQTNIGIIANVDSC